LKKNDFDHHWESNFADEIPVKKKNEAQIFLQPLFDYQKSHNSLLVLDAGCGDGVHIELIERKFDRLEGGLFIGLDISMSALRSLKERRRSKCIFVQGDIGKMPFGNDQFDIVFSFGALAYTDNPFFSFSELCRVTRTGGYVGIWVYPQRHSVGGILFPLARKVCYVSGPLCCRLIADCIVPFLGFLPTRSKMSLANASWRQCREVVLVNIAPSKLSFPQAQEIEGWFTKNNIEIIWRDDIAPVTLWGKKT
jgi:ubiquinone/menaquinone biosynthesis C-methylase UbiE